MLHMSPYSLPIELHRELHGPAQPDRGESLMCGDQSVQCHYERDHGHGEHQTGEGHGEIDADAVLVDPRAH